MTLSKQKCVHLYKIFKEESIYVLLNFRKLKGNLYRWCKIWDTFWWFYMSNRSKVLRFWKLERLIGFVTIGNAKWKSMISRSNFAIIFFFCFNLLICYKKVMQTSLFFICTIKDHFCFKGCFSFLEKLSIVLQ